MFEHAIRMRYSTDCGIASLATAMRISWEGSCAFLAEHIDEAPYGYWGVTQDAMQGAAAPGAIPSGVPLTSAKGKRGVLLVRVEHAELEGQRHWLAWEKDLDGRVWCFNPTDGEVFRAESMTGRGFYQLCHFTVA